jgi:hypothetical protein
MRLVHDIISNYNKKKVFLEVPILMCATLFRALRTAAGRWVAEEGHGDPSQACICLMPADSAV